MDARSRGGARGQPQPPSLGGELIDGAALASLENALSGAVAGTFADEARLAGAVRALAPYSRTLRHSLADAGRKLLVAERTGSPLFAAIVRALAEADDASAVSLLSAALGSSEAGGTATLSACCLTQNAQLAPALARAAAIPRAHIAFAAEVARVVRGEADGDRLAELAPRIKESHRIALATELFLPLTRNTRVPLALSTALGILRNAERHLGRWLVLAEVAVRGGDRAPIDEAQREASFGPATARSAWALVAWALEDASREVVAAPRTRPTLELVARLSHRPSAERDTTFLFRMARSRAPVVVPMLEGMVRERPLITACALRAALHLARDHGHGSLLSVIEEVASGAVGEPRQGLAIAALHDLGRAEEAAERALPLLHSADPSTLAWAALVRMKPRGGLAGPRPLVDEPFFRWIESWSPE